MGGGSQAPTPYQPAYQQQADSAYYNTLNALTPQVQADMATAQQGYNSAYNTVLNNPYDSSMVQGTVGAANTLSGVGANNLTQGGVVTGQADQVFNDANTVRGYAPQFQDLASLAKGYAAPLSADANTLRSYAPELAELGLDPNFAEYNYGMQQAKNSQNVTNAESGLAGSPFAAGMTGDAMAAYKRNYDAQRYTKAMSALSALGQLYSGAGGLDMQALQALQGSGGFLNDAIGAYDTAAGMDTAGTNIDSAGLGMEQQGANDQALAAMMPYEAVNTEAEDQLSALNAMTSGEAAAASPVFNATNAYGNYMDIGQQATAGADRAAQINYQDSFMGGLGQLLGVAIGTGAHFIPGYA